MDNKPFALITLALDVLIALALWQFHSLVWGERASSLRHLNDAPSVAAAPR